MRSIKSVYIFRMLAMYCYSLGYRLNDGYLVKDDSWIRLEDDRLWAIIYKKKGEVKVLPIKYQDSPENVLNMFKKEFDDKS